ncbi:hypothetical protein BDV27DRAFT_155642 [Aspergillus caelatus]|uniref:Nephrocystin 3-like N-terminal domain-containing protein n=1 Tax=Aspergillus caelatus TaxID=61420 RepID=A0A5N7AA44_9EURO|nr:uncharacterized protein BDV27DRAFT_155642 [Aspergillus caelatus]KAE8366751.1 hypothetical protein BDV27DRAFT_155642 [Aspergillus caelatus]
MPTDNQDYMIEIASSDMPESSVPRILTIEELLLELSAEEQDRIRLFIRRADGTTDEAIGRIVDGIHGRFKLLNDRKKSVGYQGIVYRIPKWISFFGPFGEAATAAFPLYAGFPWALIRIVTEVIMMNRNMVETLRDTFYRCRESLAHLPDMRPSQIHYNNGSVSKLNSLHRGILRFLSQVILLCGADTTKRYYYANFPPAMLRDLWEETETLLNQIIAQSHKDCEKDQHSRKEARKMIKFISNYNHEDEFQRLKDTILVSTGGWVFQHCQFHQWAFSKDSPILWIHGRVDGISSSKPDSTILYLFLGSTHAVWELEWVIRSLIKQLAILDETSVPSELMETLQRNQANGNHSARIGTTDCAKYLTKMMLLQQSPFLFIDGLDELRLCLQNEILELLQRLVHDCKQLKVMISSNKTQQIKADLKDYPYIDLDAVDRSDDERAVIQAIFAQRSRLLTHPISKEDENLFINKITDKGYGQ